MQTAENRNQQGKSKPGNRNAEYKRIQKKTYLFSVRSTTVIRVLSRIYCYHKLPREFWEAVTKLTDSAGAQETPSNE